MIQLLFPFLPPDNGPRTTQPSKYRRRLQRVAGQAYALGLIRGENRRAPMARSLGAAAPLDLPRAVYPSREDRHELYASARRVGRLTVSHRRAEDFFIERSEIEEAIRKIARRY